jgi:hypothetical protein
MITELIALALIANLLAEDFKPIQDLKDRLRLYLLPGYFGTLFYCVKCIGLWLTLAITWNLYYAVIVSYLAYLVKFIKDKIEKTYDL